MKPDFRTFDEYWSAFVREHWRPSTRNLRVAEASLALLRAAFARVAPRFAWPAAATLLAWLKTMAGTMDREVTRASEQATWPPFEATAALGAAAPPLRIRPDGRDHDRDWAVWL